MRAKVSGQAGAAGWIPPVAAAGAGIALRDCVLVAASAPLALAAFYERMDANAPMSAIHAALASALAGVGALAGAGLIILMVAEVMRGVLVPAHGWALAAAGLLAALFVVAVALPGARRSEAGASDTPWAILAVVSGAGTAELLWAHGADLARCAFALAVVALTAWMGWRLLRDVASELLRSGAER